MDHDQEKFYQDEEQESRPESQPETGREVNDMTYFLELMKHLRTLIERGSRIPLSGKVLIDADKCLMILDELDGNLPDAIQYGMQMYSEKDRILGTASNEAISRVTSAEMKANKALEMPAGTPSASCLTPRRRQRRSSRTPTSARST